MASTPTTRSALTRLATWSHRRRWLMLGLWVFALVATITVSQAVGGDYQMEFKVPGAESQRATELLKQHLSAASGDSIDVVVKADKGIDDAAVHADYDRLLAQ